MSGVIICWNFFFLQIRIFNTSIWQLIFINKCQLGQYMFLQCTKIALPLIYDTCVYLNIKSMQKISLRFKFLIFFFFIKHSKKFPLHSNGPLFFTCIIYLIIDWLAHHWGESCLQMWPLRPPLGSLVPSSLVLGYHWPYVSWPLQTSLLPEWN